MEKPIKVGDIIEVELDNLAYGGETVGRFNNFAIFVPGGIPGEKVQIRVEVVKKRYAKGELLKIIDSSPYRVTANCAVANECGGCQLQHIDYEEQLRLKQQLVTDAFQRIAGVKDAKILPTIASKKLLYRNKAQFPLGIKKNSQGQEEIITGFYAPGTHQIVPNQDCQIQHPLINRILRKTLRTLNNERVSTYDEVKHHGLLRHLLIRVGVCTNQAMLVFITNGKHFPKGQKIAQKVMEEIPELISVMQNINTHRTNVVLGKESKLVLGQAKIIDYIGDLKFAISAQSFFQVNTLQTKVLYDQVLKYTQLSGQEIVLDAYCGIGTISLYLAKKAFAIHGIELNDQAIKDAKQNAALNDLKNTFFYTGLVEKCLPQLCQDGVKFDVVVVDPPRKGCHADVLKAFGHTRPKSIVYVSCNPTTLARDVAILLEYGYELVEVQPVDMFPGTYHIETVSKLVRNDKG